MGEQEKAMRPRKHCLIAGSSAFVLLGVILAGYAECIGTPRHPMTETQADALVRRELPMDASVRQVLTWLDAQHIEHGKYEPNRANGDDGAILAIIRDTSRPSLFISADIQLKFTFGKQRRLIGHSSHTLLTGP